MPKRLEPKRLGPKRLGAETSKGRNGLVAKRLVTQPSNLGVKRPVTPLSVECCTLH